MTELHSPEDGAAFNAQSLERLVRAITLSQGQFSLILVRCNYSNLQQSMVQGLRELCPLELRELILEPSIKTLYTTIQAKLGDEQPQALMIFGLESVSAIDQVLTLTNQVREEFRKNFPFPIIFWINDQLGQKLIRIAPDFESWSTTIKFEINAEQLCDFLKETTDNIFTKVLDAGASGFVSNAALNSDLDLVRQSELEAALEDLQNFGMNLEPELEASLEFVRGQAANRSMEQSRQHYERSLALWQQDSKLVERLGCVLYTLGLWWRTYAERHRAEYTQACDRAEDYFLQCIEVFEQHHRSDLVAKFINALLEVLQQLQQWNELEVVAQKALRLHQTYLDRFRLAQAYGVLANVALAKSACSEALQFAQQALSLIVSTESDTSNSTSSTPSTNFDRMRSYHQSQYLLSLARAQSSLGQIQESIKNLETARNRTALFYDPRLNIRILQELGALYFSQGEYLKAFEIKQEQRSIEQQYGFRAFIGASRLQPQRHLVGSVFEQVDGYMTVAQEIAASGRQRDINRLIERIKHRADRLTIIHGQSGVGKSSLIDAGLVPALQQRLILNRYTVPIVLRVYTDWVGQLRRLLTNALAEIGYDIKFHNSLDTLTTILEYLRENKERNLLTILIFDQFEDFFFVAHDSSIRRQFYEFLSECLKLPSVKIILSLREDYLHFLLEFNRLKDFTVINNDILSKETLYYLGNLSPVDTKSIIQSLTDRSHFFLEPALIDALVRELAGELGEIRPIELQVVGAQLQTEGITTLAQYRECGPNEKLVERFLEEVVKDCGSENEQLAKLVLYLLTDENNTRPLKTRADLELELEVNSEKLDLVLEILVASGLVLRLPESLADRYQIIHDYLGAFIRQQQSARLIAELEKEREQRRLTEAKLNQVLKQQLKRARRVSTLAIATLLVVIAGGFWLRAEYQKEVKTYRERIEQLQKRVEQLRKELEAAQKNEFKQGN